MKKKIFEIAVLFIFLIVMAAYMERTQVSLNGNRLKRNKTGEGDKEVDLILNAEGVDKNYKYSLDLKEIIPTEEQAGEYINQAKEEIDESFCIQGETIDHVTANVNMKDSYVNGIIKAEWMLSDFTIVNSDGVIVQDEINGSGQLINATVKLKCCEYEDEYSFSFKVFPKDLNNQEMLIKNIHQEIDDKLNKEGQEELVLPDQINGVKISWEEKRTRYVLDIIVLELVMIVLFFFSEKEKKKKEIQKEKTSMQLDYPEIVSKMAILIGSGMTIEQAWCKITARYSDKRNKNQCKKRPAYDEMIITAREISDGESGRKAYQKFAQRIDLGCYQRFIRILLQSLTKGNKGMCAMLEKESDDAYKERKLLAKKLGEEASTKMLAPLMIMMTVVMAVIIAPAIISFKG